MSLYVNHGIHLQTSQATRSVGFKVGFFRGTMEKLIEAKKRTSIEKQKGGSGNHNLFKSASVFPKRVSAGFNFP